MEFVTSVPEQLGRYIIQQIIGRGSMGIVLLARDPSIDRLVAIKLIQTTAMLDEDELTKYKDRFAREAKAAGQLLHPGIVTVFDVGQSDQGIPYIVMEYVAGITLREMLKAGPLSVDDALSLSFEILDALSYAHSRGVIHRDVKPSNILITPDKHPKIMDFGIAHLIGSDFTKTDEFLGTPYFMAPEQISKNKVDQRTDLFSFGNILYQMLTGKRVFTGDSLAALVHSILQEQPVAPHKHVPEIPPMLSHIVMRCLMKVPGDRYSSAEELKQDLLHVHDHRSEDFEDEIETVAEAGFIRSRSKNVIRIAGMVILALLILVPLLILLPHGKNNNTSPPPISANKAPTPATKSAPPATKTTSNEIPTVVITGKVPQKKQEKKPQPSEANETPTEPSPAPVVTPEPVEPKPPDTVQPVSINVTHSHFFGSCDGRLTFSATGVQYVSDAHRFAWSYPEIRKLERPDWWHIRIETTDKDEYSKSYNFVLPKNSLAAYDWNRFRTVWVDSK
ncbi:MAG: hypothetical protein C5B54_03480 [Acidobacteria bacterium]|nr:MAG: hypothetical protein C5B54_03480 [Acidobacteriota bacterium]